MKDEERWSQAITWYFHLSLVMSLVILKKGVAVKAEPIWWVEKKEKWVCLSSFKLTKKENGWCCEGKAISVSNEIPMPISFWNNCKNYLNVNFHHGCGREGRARSVKERISRVSFKFMTFYDCPRTCKNNPL